MRGRQCMPRNRRSGVALVYVVVIMSALMAFCSLAVDLGRYHTAHQELYNAAVAAARAGAAAMAKSGSTTSTVSSAATTVATENYIDGQSIPSGDVTVEYLNWTSASTYTVESAANYASANSVRVTISYDVPLMFARVLGITTKTAREVSVAKVVVNTDTPTVYATGDIWLSNEPNGTTGSQADPNYTSLHAVEDHQYPHDIAGTPGHNAAGSLSSSGNYGTSIKIGFNVVPGATVTISNVSGTVSWDHDTAPSSDATGNSGTTGNYNNAKANGVAEHGISDSTMRRPISQ